MTGTVIRPVAGHLCQTLPLLATTVAELLRAAGHFVEISPDVTARQHETLLECEFMDFDLKKFTIEREPGDSPWSFIASEPIDAEEALEISHMILNCEHIFCRLRVYSSAIGALT